MRISITDSNLHRNHNGFGNKHKKIFLFYYKKVLTKYDTGHVILRGFPCKFPASKETPLNFEINSKKGRSRDFRVPCSFKFELHI